jgi:hypothetical protein
MMRIEDVIRALNEMEREGVIERYAIGGAVAATIYLEPFSTLDVDVFITFGAEDGLISLEPIYAHLLERGCELEGEYIIIAGWPVQFLPPTRETVKSRMESIEASKSRMRRKLAARPVAEKLRMLDDLRARAITLKRTPRKDSRRTIQQTDGTTDF